MSVAATRVAGGLVVLALGGAAIAVTDPFAGGGAQAESGAGAGRDRTALATIERRSLASRTSVAGTLGFAGSFSIVNQASGVVTWLPRAGQLIGRGEVLYRVNGEPVVLLLGRVPAYRALQRGMVGSDVQQLNANLAALGSTLVDPDSRTFGAATEGALEDLQGDLGVEETGTLALGEAVFLPRRARITKVTAVLGAAIAPGAPVADAGSTRRQVTVALAAAQQTVVSAGDRVRITLPDGRTTRGRVSSVGRVATSAGGEDSSPKITVRIAPRNLKVSGRLDQAPVQVEITTARVRHALVIPVTALLARAGGGYAVEALGAHGEHDLVPVATGLFDDAGGLVEVTGERLSPGMRVVVPAT